jgi:Protein of unknown function (DUF4058)
MPIHDWTRVDAGLFHDFHQDWTIELRRTLNGGLLPPGYSALTDQRIGGPIPDVLTLSRRSKDGERIAELDEDIYARRANRIKIQHRHGEVVAVIEIVSPGNKSSEGALRAFVRKSAELIWNGVHLLVIDLFPPSERDPDGIHAAIWDEIGGPSVELPADKNLTVVSYRAIPTKAAFVEPVAVGDDMPEVPLCYSEYDHIQLPLERTYRASWAAFPHDFKEMLEPAAGE